MRISLIKAAGEAVNGYFFVLALQRELTDAFTAKLLIQILPGGLPDENPARTVAKTGLPGILIPALQPCRSVDGIPKGRILQPLRGSKAPGDHRSRKNSDAQSCCRQLPLLPMSPKPFHFLFHRQGAIDRIHRILLDLRLRG